MLYNDLKYVHTTLELHNFNFQYLFYKLIISFIYGPKITKFGTHLVKDNSEGTISPILYLGPVAKKDKKFPVF